MARLDKLGRTQWAEWDSRLMLEPSLYDIDPIKAIARLKGARNLRGRQRAAAKRLTAWREQEAMTRDRPRQWILRDNVLVDIAFRLPGAMAELARIESMPPKLLQRAGHAIVSIVAKSAGDASDYRAPGPADEEQKLLLKKMQSMVAECSNDLGIAAEIIASKKELSAVINGGNRDSRVFGGWRKELIGDQLATLV